MKETFYRICNPKYRGKFQWNNRWYDPVMPKKSVFVIPIYNDKMFNSEHRNLWLDFLMTTHNVKFVYLFTIQLNFSRVKYRDLIYWKNMELEEGVIPVAYKGHTRIIRRQKIYKSSLRQAYLQE